MTKAQSRALSGCLIVLMIFQCETIAQQAQVAEWTGDNRAQSGATVNQAVGVRPFRWEHHGLQPYFPIPDCDRDIFVKMAEIPTLIEDLMHPQVGFNRPQAEYIRSLIQNGKSTEEAPEIIFQTNGSAEAMLFGPEPENRYKLHNPNFPVTERINVSAYVVNTSSPERAFQITMPASLGSIVIRIPCICGNLFKHPFPAMKPEPVQIVTEVREVPVIREVPRDVVKEIPVIDEAKLKKAIDEAVAKVPKSGDIYQDNRKYEIKKSKGMPWWVLPLILGAGGVTAALVLRDGPKKTYPLEGVISPP